MRERLTRCVEKFSVDDIYWHHIRWSIKSTKGARRADLLHTIPICFTLDFNKAQTDPACLFFFFLWLSILGVHIHTKTHALTQRLFTIQLPTILYLIYPERIAVFKWPIRFLRGRNWSSVWSTGGRSHIYTACDIQYSEAVKQLYEVPPSRCLLRQGGPFQRHLLSMAPKLLQRRFRWIQ